MKHETCQALIHAIDAYIAKADGDITDDLSDAGYVDPKETVSKIEKLEKKLAEAMNLDTETIAELLEQSDDLDDFMRNTWETYREASALADDVQEVTAAELTSVMPGLVTSYLHNSDSKLVATQISQRTTAWAESWSEQLGQVMKLTSHEGIQNILTDALSTGKSVADVARSIMDSGIRNNYSRARQTALTEMLTAHSVANHESFLQSPAVSDKEWKHTGSRRNKPRKNHVAMDGEIVPKDQPFELTGADGGTYKPMFPRDTNLPPGERINCHCILGPVVSEDVLGMSLEERRRLQALAIAEDDRKWAEELDEKNKNQSGLAAILKPINSLLPNSNGGVLKPTQTSTTQPGITSKPNDVVEYKDEDGAIHRYYYDDEGKVIMRVDNSDHGQPKAYPYGNGGAHYNRAMYDKDGNFTDWSANRCLTAKMRRLCRDIIRERDK